MTRSLRLALLAAVLALAACDDGGDGDGDIRGARQGRDRAAEGPSSPIFSECAGTRSVKGPPPEADGTVGSTEGEARRVLVQDEEVIRKNFRLSRGLADAGAIRRLSVHQTPGDIAYEIRAELRDRKFCFAEPEFQRGVPIIFVYEDAITARSVHLLVDCPGAGYEETHSPFSKEQVGHVADIDLDTIRGVQPGAVDLIAEPLGGGGYGLIVVLRGMQSCPGVPQGFHRGIPVRFAVG